MKAEKYIFVEVFPVENMNCFPTTLEVGKVYYCREYCHSIHLCPCGCGDRVDIPFKDTNEKDCFWGLSGNSFDPSIQKRSGCKSHYYIKNGNVIWS